MTDDDRPQYYIAWMSAVDPAPDPPLPIAEIRKQHQDYLRELEAKGVLLAAGPFRDADGNRHGAGMMIVRASSAEQADAISAAEPYRKYGLRAHSLTPWQWREGAISQTVRIKAGTFDFG